MYERYCELRDRSGMSDSQVAAKTGIGKSTFTDWKNGRSEPGVRKLHLLAKLFGVAIEYFLE